MSTNSQLPPYIQRGIRRSLVQLASGFDRLLLIEFEALEAHRAFAEKHFTATARALEARFKREIAQMSETERYENHDLWIDEYETTVEVLPRLQWYAQFLVAYSTFEHSLQRLCEIVERRSHLPISYKELAGSGIQRASEYLKRMVAVKAPFASTEWQRALLLGEIRNKIAHANGAVTIRTKDQKSLYRRAKALKHLKFDESDGRADAVLVLDAEFVRTALEALQKVLIDVANYELYPDVA